MLFFVLFFIVDYLKINVLFFDNPYIVEEIKQ